MTSAVPIRERLAALLAAREASFSIGVHGAIAEFHWVDGDRVECEQPPLALATARGAIAIGRCEDAGTLAAAGDGHDGAAGEDLLLWLPEADAALAPCRGLTEVGEDARAVRPADRTGVLFDLGLGLGHVRACVRTTSPDLIERLRAAAGSDVLEPGSAAMAAIKELGPHRVFESALARIEVFQPIPSRARGERTPRGPHTHVLPSLLSGRAAQPPPPGLPPGTRVVLAVHTGAH